MGNYAALQELEARIRVAAISANAAVRSASAKAHENLALPDATPDQLLIAKRLCDRSARAIKESESIIELVRKLSPVTSHLVELAAQPSVDALEPAAWLLQLRGKVSEARQRALDTIPSPKEEKLKRHRLKIFAPPHTAPQGSETALDAIVRQLESHLQALRHMLEELPSTEYKVVLAKPNGIRLIGKDPKRTGFTIEGMVTRQATVIAERGHRHAATMRAASRLHERPGDERTVVLDKPVVASTVARHQATRTMTSIRPPTVRCNRSASSRSS